MMKPLQLGMTWKSRGTISTDLPSFREISRFQGRSNRIEEYLGRWQIEPLGRTALHGTEHTTFPRFRLLLRDQKRGRISFSENAIRLPSSPFPPAPLQP